MDQFESCYIAKSPARAVMVRPDWKSSPVGKAVQAALANGGGGTHGTFFCGARMWCGAGMCWAGAGQPLGSRAENQLL